MQNPVWGFCADWQNSRAQSASVFPCQAAGLANGAPVATDHHLMTMKRNKANANNRC